MCVYEHEPKPVLSADLHSRLHCRRWVIPSSCTPWTQRSCSEQAVMTSTPVHVPAWIVTLCGRYLYQVVCLWPPQWPCFRPCCYNNISTVYVLHVRTTTFYCFIYSWLETLSSYHIMCVMMSYTAFEQYSREGILLFSCMISALWYQECVLLHAMQRVIKSQQHSSAVTLYYLPTTVLYYLCYVPKCGMHCHMF